VYGEGPRDRELAIAELDAVRNPSSVLDIHGEFPMKAAGRVTDEDIESSHLILFGTPESHPILRRISGSLPAALVRPGDDGSRAIFIYPNPESPGRYVVVWPTRLLSVAGDALRYAWIMPLGLLPDHVRVLDGKVVAGGHFDSDWKLVE